MTADAFRAALERHGLTQLGVCAFLNVGERTVRRWATGEVEVPRSVELVFALMDRFGLSPADL